MSFIHCTDIVSGYIIKISQIDKYTSEQSVMFWTVAQHHATVESIDPFKCFKGTIPCDSLLPFSCVVSRGFRALAPIAGLEEANLALGVRRFCVGPLLPWRHVPAYAQGHCYIWNNICHYYSLKFFYMSLNTIIYYMASCKYCKNVQYTTWYCTLHKSNDVTK